MNNKIIKFRVWDLNNEKLIPADQILHIEFNNKGIHWIGFWYPTYDSDGDAIQATGEVRDFKIMQFTGWKDKNNKEIYEGDLLKDKWSEKIGVIGWDDILLAYSLKLGNEFLTIPKEKINREIIGNIYEKTNSIKCPRCNDNGCPACDGTKGDGHNPEPY